MTVTCLTEKGVYGHLRTQIDDMSALKKTISFMAEHHPTMECDPSLHMDVGSFWRESSQADVSQIPIHAYHYAVRCSEAPEAVAEIWRAALSQVKSDASFRTFARQTLQSAEPHHMCGVIAKSWAHVGVLPLPHLDLEKTSS